MKLNINHDKVTTVLGAVGAAVNAAEPVMSGINTGVLHQGDWLRLAMSVMMALYGYSTNKK